MRTVQQTKNVLKHINSKRVFVFDNPPYVVGRMSVVGQKEGEGPLGKYFHRIENDATMGQDSFENAEIAIMQRAVQDSIISASMKLKDIDLFVSGDLMNQLTTSNFVARNLGLPFVGLYSACSSMSQALAMAATMIDAGHCDNVVCAGGSHFASAERQFRLPLEYGGQKPPYAQWTVTGAGSTVLSRHGNGVQLTKAMYGRVIDLDIKDMANMGAAMAPAFVNTLVEFLDSSGTTIEDYDLVVSGDLGRLGSDIARILASEQKINLGKNYIDCGAIIYAGYQKAYQGGSGCGCSAAVVSSYVLNNMEQGNYNRVLYLATGALMSTVSSQQGESIPCISHAVLFEAKQTQ